MDKALYLQKEYNNDHDRPYPKHHRICCYIRCHHGRDDVCCTLVHLRMRRQDGVDASPRSPNFLDRDGVGSGVDSFLQLSLLAPIILCFSLFGKILSPSLCKRGAGCARRLASDFCQMGKERPKPKFLLSRQPCVCDRQGRKAHL